MIQRKFIRVCRYALQKSIHKVAIQTDGTLIIRNGVWKRTFTSTRQTYNHKHMVIVSKSTNMYANLALEEWLYEKKDLSELSMLYLWADKPCIVIGRHQNPWLECNAPEAIKRDVDIARRGSGGGTVYHDEGNLNCSFIENRKKYDRRKNLEFVVEAIMSKWNVDLTINCRDDIILDSLYKISGSASRLTRDKTYHHLTVLFKADIDTLQTLLNSPLSQGVSSKATPSKVSQVKNLTDYAPDMDFDSLVKVMSQQFTEKSEDSDNTITWVEPEDEDMFPGVLKIKEKLMHWDWIYGKTPKFSIKKSVLVSGDITNIVFEVDKGQLCSVDIDGNDKISFGDTVNMINVDLPRIKFKI